MAKVHLLGANRSYDRDVQTVSINQIVVLEGYAGFPVPTTIPVGVSWSFHPVDKASTNLITALVSGLLSDWIHPNITITEVLLLIQSAVLILFLLSHALTDKTFLLQVFRKVERSH